ncbi:MAG: 4'-phosphopantetheinyl transferase superfamily protein [Chloroflexota bacterium]
MSEDWLAPPTGFRLLSGQVQVWRASLDRSQAEQDAFWQFLAPAEQARAERFRFDIHRHYYIVGRGLLRWLIGKYLEVSPAAVEFIYSKYDKPALGADPTFCFNVSHSHGKLLIGFVWGADLGVDIEQVCPLDGMDAIARRFFSEAENLDYAQVPAELRPEAFFNCWTRKEAFIKAVGEGLSFPLDEFDVTLLPAEPAALRSVRGSVHEAARWSMVTLDPFPGYRGALVWQGTGMACTFWDGDAVTGDELVA